MNELGVFGLLPLLGLTPAGVLDCKESACGVLGIIASHGWRRKGETPHRKGNLKPRRSFSIRVYLAIQW